MRDWLPELAALTPAPEAAAPGWQCSAEPTCTTPEFGCKTCAASKKGKASGDAPAPGTSRARSRATRLNYSSFVRKTGLPSTRRRP